MHVALRHDKTATMPHVMRQRSAHEDINLDN